MKVVVGIESCGCGGSGGFGSGSGEGVGCDNGGWGCGQITYVNDNKCYQQSFETLKTYSLTLLTSV